MAYIGQGIKQGTFKVLDTSGNTYNGSNTTFSLGTQVGSAAQLLVSHDGVIQKAGTDYTLATGGTQITFSTAPASGASIFITEISGAVGGTVTPSDNSVGITQLNVSDGSNGQALTTNGSGTLSFSTISTGLTGIDDQSSSNDDQLTITDTAVVINEDSDDVDFRVESNGNANMLVVNGGGDRVGIGSDPDLGAGLHIKTSDTGASVSSGMDELVLENGSANCGLTILSANDGLARIAFGDDGDSAAGGIDYYHDGNHLRVVTAGSERVRVNGNGNFSIGTTGDHQKLYVYGSHHSENGLVKLHTSNGSGAADIMFFMDGNNHDCGEIYLDASANTVAYNTSSDYRLKENEVAISDGIDRVKKLKPYRFNWISKPDQTVDGFFAHEVQGIVDEAITGEKDAMKTANNVVVNADGTVERHDVTKEDWEQGKIDGVYANDSTWEATKQVIKRQSIDQSKLVPLLTAALQEAVTKIEALEARVTTLEG